MDKIKIFLLFLLLMTATANGTRIKVTVIDSGIDLNRTDLRPFLCDSGHKDYTKSVLGIHDEHGHGTNIAWLVVQNLDHKKVCLVIKKWVRKQTIDGSLLGKALADASVSDTRYINISGGGSAEYVDETASITKALADKKNIVVSAGNDGRDLGKRCYYFPACTPTTSEYFWVVGSCINGTYSKYSNFGGPVKYCENGNQQGPQGLRMSGTSQSAAIFTNKLLLKHFKKIQ